eukprot:INCI6057.1.p1 GENE.INCI6057.1~~INCI6057.1.p1  ORF type:complete len:432 (-),score=73.64 INCI6057.1:1275-2570(-)
MPQNAIDAKNLRQTLQAYRYSSPTQSLMERVFLVRQWNWFAEFLPRNVAPNVLTLTGFAAALVAWGVIMAYSPDLSGKCPTSLYPGLAILLWIYQTMDGCDGPQARRLKCGSALGELVDHGVDAVVTTIDILVLFEIVGLSLTNSAVLIAILGGHVAFLLSNMTLLHLGRQQFNEIDCQEAQMVIQAMLVVMWVKSTYFDTVGEDVQAFGETAVPLPGLVAQAVSQLPGAEDFRVSEGSETEYASFELRWLFVAVGAIFSTGGNTVSMYGRILKHYFGKSGEGNDVVVASAGEEAIGSGLLARQTLSMCVWCVLVTLSWYLVLDISDTGIWPLWMVMVTFGFGSFALNSLVIRVTKHPLPSVFATPAFLIVGSWCVIAMLVPRENTLVLWCALALPAAAAILQEVDYAMRIAGKITDALDIPFWTVPKPKS